MDQQEQAGEKILHDEKELEIGIDSYFTVGDDQVYLLTVFDTIRFYFKPFDFAPQGRVCDMHLVSEVFRFLLSWCYHGTIAVSILICLYYFLFPHFRHYRHFGVISGHFWGSFGVIGDTIPKIILLPNSLPVEHLYARLILYFSTFSADI